MFDASCAGWRADTAAPGGVRGHTMRLGRADNRAQIGREERPCAARQHAQGAARAWRGRGSTGRPEVAEWVELTMAAAFCRTLFVSGTSAAPVHLQPP